MTLFEFLTQVIYGHHSWFIFDMTGKPAWPISHINYPNTNQIFSLKMLSLTSYTVVSWSGDDSLADMGLQASVDGQLGALLACHTAVTINKKQTRAFVCDADDTFTISCYGIDAAGNWAKEFSFKENADNVLMLELSKEENWCIATVLRGFKLWSVGDIRGLEEKVLALPYGIRNVRKKFGVSNSLIMSARDELAVAGIRKEIYIWKVETEELVKVLNAHFQRIIDIKSLVVGKDNLVITSSIDRSIKVWNLDCVFEKVHHIDKHELTIEGISVSTKAQIAVTVR